MTFTIEDQPMQIFASFFFLAVQCDTAHYLLLVSLYVNHCLFMQISLYIFYY